ncbi:MAG: hypothetical protein F6K23_38215 [Okeania sp. SIO2C9]|uniref:hypothetical protein n=1 Tax=Okeania sp. SIO2C9 TaxID=2607791 RepID=UPI0013C25775|nr:hypothetical protein [Okeania sp. SIO2C9]NEQ78312.1 hypothetical protein [Okeania sp. SIO2C9]
MNYVRLGEFAHKHSQKLGNPGLYNWCLSQERPILVEDEPAILPEPVKYVVDERCIDLGNYHKSNDEKTYKNTE